MAKVSKDDDFGRLGGRFGAAASAWLEGVAAVGETWVALVRSPELKKGAEKIGDSAASYASEASGFVVDAFRASISAAGALVDDLGAAFRKKPAQGSKGA